MRKQQTQAWQEVQEVNNESRVRAITLYYMFGAAVAATGAWNQWGWAAGLLCIGITVMVAAVVETFS